MLTVVEAAPVTVALAAAAAVTVAISSSAVLSFSCAVTLPVSTCSVSWIRLPLPPRLPHSQPSHDSQSLKCAAAGAEFNEKLQIAYTHSCQ